MKSVPYEIVKVIPDWESGEVDYASPPVVGFLVRPRITFDEQYTIQMAFDDAIQSASQGEIASDTFDDMQRAYSIRVMPGTDTEESLVECVFPTVRRSHFASGGGALRLTQTALTNALKGPEALV